MITERMKQFAGLSVNEKAGDDIWKLYHDAEAGLEKELASLEKKAIATWEKKARAQAKRAGLIGRDLYSQGGSYLGTFHDVTFKPDMQVWGRWHLIIIFNTPKGAARSMPAAAITVK